MITIEKIPENLRVEGVKERGKSPPRLVKMYMP